MAKKILIVLDPGHYPKYNKGVVGGYYEGDKMYTLTEYEKTALEKYGFTVIITRKRSSDMALYSRGQVAVKNGKGYDTVVFISNHSNAGVSSANGVEVYRSLYLPDSEDLATKLMVAIEKVMDAETGLTKNRYRGVKTRKCNYGDYYGVIRGAVSGATSTATAKKGVVDYAFLIEHGFHTNKKECAFLNDDDNLKKIAEVKAEVLADYFDMTKTQKSTSTVKNTSSTKYFKKYTGSSGSIVDALKAIGATNTFAYRTKIAKVNNIASYKGTPTQNTKLLELLKKGKLIKP